MTIKEITTLQIQNINAETLLKKFDALQSQISELKKEPTPQTEKLMTRKETAKLLGVSLITLYNWTNSNILKVYRIGNQVRFKESEVFEALQSINSNNKR